MGWYSVKAHGQVYLLLLGSVITSHYVMLLCINAWSYVLESLFIYWILLL